MAHLPRSIEEIDPAWLSEVLGAPITSFETELLEGGVLADAFRLSQIRCASPSARVPRSLICKLASQHEKRREMAIENKAYLKELRFFRELAAEMPLRIPTLYHGDTDGSDDARRFILVMEDLGEHSRVFDQVNDNPDEAFMRKIATDVARMHAKYWEAPETRLHWISTGGHRYVFTFDASCREAPERADEFLELWQRIYGRDLFDEGEVPSAEPLTRLLCGRSSGAVIDEISDRLSRRPHTLLHGDLRADNIFRSDPDRGLSIEDSELSYIDWQLMGVGPPGIEMAQAWIHSLPPELRRKDLKVLELYHAELVSLNPEALAYSLEMLIEDYVLGLCLWWPTLVTIGANTLPDLQEPGNERMRRLWEISIPRTLIALEDHQCLRVLESIAAA